MTDDEIKKALECCGNIVDSTCKECAYHETYNASCVVRLMRNTLDLINRQKAEIEKLEKENTVFGEIIKKQDDEISALRKDILKRENLEESFSKSVKQFDKRLEKTVKLERAEAIKEFAERLNGTITNAINTYYNSNGGGYYLAEDVIEDIDNLVKEMTEV